MADSFSRMGWSSKKKDGAIARRRTEDSGEQSIRFNPGSPQFRSEINDGIKPAGETQRTDKVT